MGGRLFFIRLRGLIQHSMDAGPAISCIPFGVAVRRHEQKNDHKRQAWNGEDARAVWDLTKALRGSESS